MNLRDVRLIFLGGWRLNVYINPQVSPLFLLKLLKWQIINNPSSELLLFRSAALVWLHVFQPLLDG